MGRSDYRESRLKEYLNCDITAGPVFYASVQRRVREDADRVIDGLLSGDAETVTCAYLHFYESLRMARLFLTQDVLDLFVEGDVLPRVLGEEEACAFLEEWRAAHNERRKATRSSRSRGVKPTPKRSS